MAVRINKARNFKGKAYVAADELDSLIQSLTFAKTTTSVTDDTWLVQFTTADGSVANTSAVDLTAIKTYIDNKSITVTAGNGISIDSTNSLSPTISTNLKIVKLGTATTGYAASYQLQYLNHNYTQGGEGDAGKEYLPVTGDTIDIVKDQFLKGAVLGYGTYTDGMTTDPADWTTTQDGTKDAILKLMFNKNTDGNATDTEEAYNVYINVTGMFKDKTAGAYIDATALSSNVIKVNVGNGIDGTDTTAIKVKVDSASESVYTVKGTTAPVLSVGEGGVKISNIQAAINNAVTAEHLTASAAIEVLESQVSTFEGNTSNAVTALNTRIEAVATNAAGAVNSLKGDVVALDSKVDTAFADADTKIENAVDSAVAVGSAALVATVTTINTNVSAVASGLNDRIVAVATNAQNGVQAVGSAVDALDTKVDGAFSNLDTAINNAIDAVESNITSHTANAVQILSTSAVMTTGAVTRTATINDALHIIGVFDGSGIQVYPEITKGTGSYSLGADFESDAATETWTVYYTQALTTLKTADAVATDYATAATVAGTTVGNGISASYTAATATAPAEVTVADITYADPATIADKTVGNGAPATAPAVNASVEKEAPSYQANA